MAKGKKQSKRPQAKHKPKSRSSQHDKRKRLDTPNPRRKKTVKAKVPLTGKDGSPGDINDWHAGCSHGIPAFDHHGRRLGKGVRNQ